MPFQNKGKLEQLVRITKTFWKLFYLFHLYPTFLPVPQSLFYFWNRQWSRSGWEIKRFSWRSAMTFKGSVWTGAWTFQAPVQHSDHCTTLPLNRKTRHSQCCCILSHEILSFHINPASTSNSCTQVWKPVWKLQLDSQKFSFIYFFNLNIL